MSSAPSWCTNEVVEDRRAAPRHEAYVSAALETPEGRSTIAITRDMSARGLLILTRLAVQVGDVVKLRVALDGAERTLSGKVVRVESLEAHELWRQKVALAVEGDDPTLAQLEAKLAEDKPR